MRSRHQKSVVPTPKFKEMGYDEETHGRLDAHAAIDKNVRDAILNLTNGMTDDQIWKKGKIDPIIINWIREGSDEMSTYALSDILAHLCDNLKR